MLSRFMRYPDSPDTQPERRKDGHTAEPHNRVPSDTLNVGKLKNLVFRVNTMYLVCELLFLRKNKFRLQKRLMMR